MKEYFLIKVKNKKQYILNIYNEDTDDIACTFTTYINKAKRWTEEESAKYLIFKLVFILNKIELECVKKKIPIIKPIIEDIKIPEIEEELLFIEEEAPVIVEEEIKPIIVEEIKPIKKTVKKPVKKPIKKKPKVTKKVVVKEDPIIEKEVEKQPEKKETVLTSLKGIISKKIKKIQEDIKYYY